MATEFIGPWRSEVYGVFCHGTARVTLPDRIVGRITVDATILYSGVYRFGCSERVRAVFSEDVQSAEAAAAFVTPAVSVRQGSPPTPSGTGKLSFTVLRRTEDTVSGRYELTNPADRGTFELSRYADAQPAACAVQ